MNGLEMHIVYMFIIGYLFPTVVAYFIYRDKKEILKKQRENCNKEHVEIWGWMDYFPHDTYLLAWVIITLAWLYLVVMILIN